jgi:dCMP deaminase
LLCDKSKCGYKTGCMIVKDGAVLAEGWNATLPGETYCQSGECVRKKENLYGGKDIDKVCSIHAEAYAVAECASKGIAIAGADVYVTTFPCTICARLLAKCGIGWLFYMCDYMGGKTGESVLVASGVKMSQIKEEDVWKN